MKNLKLYIALTFAVVVASCSEDDKITVGIQDTVERGAVLRTISIDPNTFNIFDADSPYTITLEEQDYEDGGLLSSVDVFVNFVDNTESNGTTTATETLLTSIPASAFSSGPNGLPRTTFSVGYGESLTALGIQNDPSEVFGGDQINIRLVLNLTDGRSFTDTDNTGNIVGSFFSSPFAYRATVVCPPTVPTSGTWTIDFQDSYGDGWNGASLDVSIDGGDATVYTLDDGAAGSVDFEVPDGSESISIIFTSGDWDVEVSAQVFSANGNQVIDLMPSPTAGVELLDYCLDNL